MSATAAQIRDIHAIANRAGLDEATRRDLIAQVASGKRSSKELDQREAARVIARLRELAPATDKRLAKGSLDLKGPYVPIGRALWISGWHLGVIRDRTDIALCRFVERQTGISALGWVTDVADATAVIQALRAMLAQQGGVVWPKAGTRATALGHGRLEKLAVHAAQCRLLGLPEPLEAPVHLDDAIARLGKDVRAKRRAR